MVGQQIIKPGQEASRPPVSARLLFGRKLPVGAEIVENGVHFRVWAPSSQTAAVKMTSPSGGEATIVKLDPEAGGYFAGLAPETRANMLYKIQIESGEFPDPASRFQPEGPHGPSQIIDPSSFHWTDKAWGGVSPQGQMIYEMH